MDKVLIAQLGVEGGGADIFGKQTDGVWSLWTEGTSIDFDEHDDGEDLRDYQAQHPHEGWAEMLAANGWARPERI